MTPEDVYELAAILRSEIAKAQEDYKVKHGGVVDIQKMRLALNRRKKIRQAALELSNAHREVTMRIFE